jgi:hypothetical protein
MTDERMALLARLEQAAGTTEPDVLRETLRWAIEEAPGGERSPSASARSRMSGRPSASASATATAARPARGSRAHRLALL